MSDPLLQSFSIKKATFRNRIMSTSHACGLEQEGAMPAETYQRYHEEKARGGIGLTMFGGSAYVSEDSTWSSGQLNMSTDRVLPYLEKFSERIHQAGAGIMIQLTHLGRRGETNTQNWLPTLGPSVVRETGHRSFPREMDKYDIRRVVKEFGQAALRARKGGLDGMESMVGGHLIGQFLSPDTNLRTDEYGGSLENRCRFGLMVHEEIRNQVGDDFIVGMRFPIDEAVKDGLGFDECVQMAQIFQRSGLVDYFNANYGRLDTELKLLTDCMPGMASPIAPWLQVAGAFKQEVQLPVFHAARITDLSTARYAIREGLLDMVAMTRAHIADPHIVNKIERGEEDRIRPCVGMTHCMGVNRPTCIHNPATARENHWPQVIESASVKAKKCVVVGAGPAGLEAARVLAERGHDVKVFEASDQAGGQLRLATKASWRGDVTAITDWRLQELEHFNVPIVFNTLADDEITLAEEPEIVILATGGLPFMGNIQGEQHCTSVWDVLGGSVPLKDSAVVYDGTGRHPALIAAEMLVDQGKNMQLVLLDDRPATELDYGERIIWKRELAKRKITPLLDHKLISVTSDGNNKSAHFISELTGEEMMLEGNQVIVEHGTLPADDLFHSLRSASNNDGVTDIKAFLAGQPQPALDASNGFSLFRIGDALSSRNLAAAMFDALRLCSPM